LRIDNHGNAAMPDSHPDCRWLLTQIAALQFDPDRECLLWDKGNLGERYRVPAR